MSRLLAWTFLIHPLMCYAGSSNIMSHPNWQLLNHHQCGIANSERIVGGTNAIMGSYPWLAQIGYIPRNIVWAQPSYSCGGAVINEFYILTAAHCTTDIINDLIPVRVRLGEHDVRTNPDCEHSFCNDPYQEYEIDEIITHENWDTEMLKNDIALLRLNQKIIFTDFIRPICLIKGQLLKKNFVGQVGEVAGWGVFDVDAEAVSPILQTIKLSILPVSNCSSNVKYIIYSIDSNQMCVGGQIGRDSCSGDSGGPLMKVESGVEAGPPRYYVLGIVSFGLRFCGKTNTPGVYTNLSKYLSWVLDHLRA